MRCTSTFLAVLLALGTVALAKPVERASHSIVERSPLDDHVNNLCKAASGAGLRGDATIGAAIAAVIGKLVTGRNPLVPALLGTAHAVWDNFCEFTADKVSGKTLARSLLAVAQHDFLITTTIVKDIQGNSRCGQALPGITDMTNATATSELTLPEALIRLADAAMIDPASRALIKTTATVSSVACDAGITSLIAHFGFFHDG